MEVIVAVAVLSIILSVAAPSFSDMMNRNRLKVAAEAIYAHLQFVRSEAIKQGRDLFVRIKLGDDSVSENWCVGISNSSGCDCDTSGSCRYGPAASLIENNLSSANHDAIKLQSNRTGIKFDSRRGTSNVVGTVSVINANLDSISIIISSRGRVRLCSNDIAGYSGCN
ncbi:MAG: GspH/FimT family pseudopilin [Lamprobacter sp.]|uniref:GspH/FimT family pseudopilin n=1 Tax=Lamprobacter sp. TaxID=3100796 RepID=UPI002B259199|nr:GspH/FimT family pseudopilin [Lamprobacter sp.]MEA3638504.1 GspH/FimT family pseudopilin [Lamprobacter sp.]